jgi:hypothetical protein
MHTYGEQLEMGPVGLRNEVAPFVANLIPKDMSRHVKAQLHSSLIIILELLLMDCDLLDEEGEAVGLKIIADFVKGKVPSTY